MSPPLQIFFDLDGVLADFVGGALAHHGRSIPFDEIRWGFPEQIGFDGPNDPAFWSPLGYDFWRCLPVLDDGMQALAHAEKLFGAKSIAILTAPCKTRGCLDGKRDWVAHHLPGYSRRLIFASAKGFLGGPNKVLVDDRDENIDSWQVTGGVGVLFPRPWNRGRGWEMSVNQNYLDSIERLVR